MKAFEAIAEQRILDAIDAGELDDLPGAGKPMKLADESLIPAEVRAAYRVMSNARVMPAELSVRARINRLELELDDLREERQRHAVRRRLALLHFQLEVQSKKSLAIAR